MSQLNKMFFLDDLTIYLINILHMYEEFITNTNNTPNDKMKYDEAENMSFFIFSIFFF